MIPGGGIDRFIGTEGLSVDEGGVALIRTRNLNTSGILAFIRRHRQQGVAVERYSYEHDKHQPPLLRLRVSCRPLQLHTALKVEFLVNQFSTFFSNFRFQYLPKFLPHVFLIVPYVLRYVKKYDYTPSYWHFSNIFDRFRQFLPFFRHFWKLFRPSGFSIINDASR